MSAATARQDMPVQPDDSARLTRQDDATDDLVAAEHEPAQISLVQQVGVTVFLMLIGVGLIVGGISYDVGTLAAPKSGFVPMVVGASMVVFGAVLLVQDLTRHNRHSALEEMEGGHQVADDAAVSGRLDEGGAADQAEPSTSRTSGPISLLICIASFVFVLFGTELLGLLVTSAIVVGVLAFLMKTSWWGSILVGGGFYAFGYVVFAMWLEIPMPFGTITGG